MDSRLGSQTPLLKDVQIGIPSLPDAGSETHLRVLREWIQNCDRAHSACAARQRAFVPTRLLYIGDDHGQGEGGSGTVRLVEHVPARGGSVRYVALSHRWGSPAQNAASCTFTTNIDRRRRGVPAAELPRAFQDAIFVARGLGLQYVWIDSMCIVQDDPRDWDAESKLMELVFSAACCTVAATCSSGCSDGFLKPRPQRRTVAMRSPDGARYYACEPIDDFQLHVEQSELNQRGWVLQERALSRRTIYFTETQSYWECGAGVQCETMTKMSNRKASFLGDANFPHSVDAYVKGMKIKLVQDLYVRYSQLALSFASDRPVAIRGLELRLMETLGTPCRYGVFEIYLPHCLLWQRFPGDKKQGKRIRNPGVPSWSWMACEGGIRYLDIPLGNVAWRDDVVSPFPKAGRGGDPVQIGQDTDPSLDLGVAVWDIVDPSAAQIFLDEHRAGPFQFAVLGRNKIQSADDPHAQCYGLVVQPVARDADGGLVYERVGVGVLQRFQLAPDRLGKRGKIR